uniref:Uncharacterized protein n=1 Tax=Nelumbo nucifera TaxID=4432 RepID=A0A822ZM19_NELNU|nr:TPA_asm: hypothetical protein HUJ06_004167 [Nelumbo nucifera]
MRLSYRVSTARWQRQWSLVCRVVFYSGSVDKFQRQDGSGGGARVTRSSFTPGPSSVDKFQPQDGSGEGVSHAIDVGEGDGGRWGGREREQLSVERIFGFT